MAPKPLAAAGRLARIERLERFARRLDAAWTVPGTRIRIGLDPLLGLIPGVGDAAGLVLSSWILVEAARLGVGRPTLLRMGGRVALESLVGTIPLLGDLFDVGYRANLRNVAHLRRHLGAEVYASRP